MPRGLGFRVCLKEMPGMMELEYGSAAGRSPVVYSAPQLNISSTSLVAWGNGNQLRVSTLPQAENSAESPTVFGIQLGGDMNDERRRIAYGSLPAFALLQNQRQMLLSSHGQKENLPSDWWEHVLEYSRSLSSMLDNEDASFHSAEKSSKAAEKSSKDQRPTIVRAIWDLIEIFYVDKGVTSWLPERLVDWLASYDKAFSYTESTIYSKLVSLQDRISFIQFPEDDQEYWDGITGALSVGWFDVVVSFLRMHGSYRIDQIDDRQTENGLVEAFTLLISKMPRLRPNLPEDQPGSAHSFKPDFAKAWERWRSQVAKLENSTFWAECSHRGTLVGLKRMLQVLLGNVDVLVLSTCHWMELLVAHFLYVIPFSMVSEGMLSIATKCKELKQCNDIGLRELMTAILSNDTEILLAECSILFDPWLMAHVGDLLVAKNSYVESLLQEEREELGDLSMQELHRLVYVQLLSSHPLTWQLAPVYLASCPKRGLGMLENLLMKQKFAGNNKLALKALEICRLYDLGAVAMSISRMMGMHCLKRKEEGAGIMWLQRAGDEKRLSAIAQKLLDSVTSGQADEMENNFEHVEKLLDLVGGGVDSIEGLSFLHRYREYKGALQSIKEIVSQESYSEKVRLVGRAAVDSLLQLLKPGKIPRRFWVSMMEDSVALLDWPEHVLMNEEETNVLLRSVEDCDVGDGVGMEKVRLGLATNLGRAVLQSH